jgi:MIP family channel proteins
MKKGLAELIGTLTLVYVGVMVVSVSGGDLVAVALAHGLAIACMVSALMTISGGQFNPAVTVGLLVARKITPMQAAINVGAQMLGGLVGGYLALASLPDGTAFAGVPDLGGGISLMQGILIEAVLTFFLMLVIMGSAVDPRFGARIGGLAIGLTVTLDILAGGPLTGAAMNPARWFGAAVPGMHFANALVYFVGPLAGAIAAALVYDAAFLAPDRPHPEPQAQMRAKGNP